MTQENQYKNMSLCKMNRYDMSMKCSCNEDGYNYMPKSKDETRNLVE